MVPKQAVIFCGGRGERLRPLTDTMPKPMVPLHGKPFLEYLVEQLQTFGVERILLLTGYRGEQIHAHFGDRVTYHHGPEGWETGRRLAEAAHLLDERFVLMYADNIAPVSLPWLASFHAWARFPLTISAVFKPGGNVLMQAGRVRRYSSTETDGNHVDIGYMIAERDPVVECCKNQGSFSRVISKLALSNQLAGFNPEGLFYHSISDTWRLQLTEKYVSPKKIILIDRDGVINRKAPQGEYITRVEDFVFIEENVTRMEKLAKDGFEFIVLSNQAGVGRGIMSLGDLDNINKWMREKLANRGVVVRETFCCPHHWIDNCICRKPKTGMFFAASNDFDFMLHKTVYIGDDERDRQAAWRAGCRFSYEVTS